MFTKIFLAGGTWGWFFGWFFYFWIFYFYFSGNKKATN